MVYDIFTFFYEADLLEIRLNILDPYVDYFVIVEATETFMGIPKPSYYLKNIKRFAKWRHKIIHYLVDDFPNDKELLKLAKSSPSVGNGEMHWVREFYQKESIKKALKNLDDEDVCYVSDVDEIWRPGLEIDFTKDRIFRPQQRSYLYYLNNRASGVDLWTGTIVTKYKYIKNSCLNHMRTRKGVKYTVIRDGGWHFECLGGLEGIRRKLHLYRHPDYFNDNNIASLEERFKKNEDYKGRNLKIWVDESDLPEYLLENKKKYSKFFKTEDMTDRQGKWKWWNLFGIKRES